MDTTLLDTRPGPSSSVVAPPRPPEAATPPAVRAPERPRQPRQPVVESEPAPNRELGHLPALDGVRAFAVLSVMAYHGGFGGLSGGFLGVDTFFTLSGFLITTLLVTEWAATGTIRLGAFWGRRARRLLPALLLVLLFVAVYASVIVQSGTYPGLRADSLFTLFYTANWHFIAAGSNYFTATGPPSPLTHTWSLAVEEQFYLIWPLVVLGVMVLCKRRTAQGLRVLLGVSVVGALMSAVEMAVLYNGTNQTRLYYGTDTHAQCLLVGASLAVLLAMYPAGRYVAGDRTRRRIVPRVWLTANPSSVPSPSSGRRPATRGLTLVGLTGAGVTAVMWWFWNGQRWSLYHGGFLVAALATAAVLLAVARGPETVVTRTLARRPLRYVGRISYGVYLWHFPLFLWLDHGRTGLSGLPLFGLRVMFTMLVATLSYRWVEEPIRRGSFLRGWRTAVAAPVGVAGVAGVMALATAPVGASGGLAASPTAAAHTAAAVGDAPVLVVGDSMAQTLANGIGGAVGQHFGLDVINAGDPNCSLAIGTFEVQDYGPNTGSAACDPQSGQPLWPSEWTSLVNQDHPAVSVFLSRLDIVNRLFDGNWTHIGDPAYDDYLLGQMRLAVNVLTARGGKVVFLTSPYYDTGEQPDGSPWPEDDPSRVDAYNAMLERVATEYPGKAFVVDLNRVADPAGHYQPVIDGVDVRYTDGIHWTYQGDCWLAPRILPPIAAVARTGSLPPPATLAADVNRAVETFPTNLCHAPN